MRTSVLSSAVLTLLLATVGSGQNQISNIVGGEDAGAQEFPFVAKIRYGSGRVGCTGSLIDVDRVVTAGHCVSNYGRLVVEFGDSLSTGPQYAVVERTVHPEYSVQVNDIAVLHLDQPVQGIQPVPILTLEDELRYAPSGTRSVAAAGWGDTTQGGNGSSRPTRLQVVRQIPMYTAVDCRRVLDDLRRQGKKPQPPSIHEKGLCAGEEGRAIGSGDSGGPLLVQTPNGWSLIGVLSQRTQDPEQTVTYMAHWTRTSYYIPWMFPTHYLYFPHSARGNGWATDLVLLNPSGSPADADVEVFVSTGNLRTEESVPLQEWSLVERRIPNRNGILEIGGVIIGSQRRLSGFLRMTSTYGDAISVQPTPVGHGFVVPVSPNANRVGFAVFNADVAAAVVTFQMNGETHLEAIAPNGSVARFADEFFRDPRNLIKVESDSAISVLILELVGEKLVTLPATRIK